jgi:thiamine biosynthesis lipoprotein
MDMLRILSGAGLALAPMVSAIDHHGVWQLLEDDVLGAPASFAVGAPHEAHARTAISAALSEIERLNGVFNSRSPASELFALNHLDSMKASPELFEVVTEAELMRARSSGAYNPTLGRVIDLWRGAEDEPPDPSALQAAADAARGPVRLDAKTRTITRPKGATFALDSLAKGYIIDKALKAGLAAAPQACGMLVDIGGDIGCSGLWPAGTDWRVGIPDPGLPYLNAPLVAEAYLRHQAIATSGRVLEIVASGPGFIASHWIQ